ncbi:F-box DNA helicase 1 [Geodia barretti]|uniref:F-box DNA helicase 1 n=1 Tax=Geodia barretti TaxID=519541 RepID=A0AA35SX25_GEOBA|nr:F-box DNA helicase 1 [Geodia barretti]
MAEGRSSEARDDEVLITRVSPPPPKRSKVDKEEVAELVYVDSEEPLRCSTPHDSIDVFIDETSSSLPPVGAVVASFSTLPHLIAVPHSVNKDERREQELLFGLNNEYAEAFLKEEESDKAALVEEILTCPTSAQGAVDGKCGVERSNGWGRGSEVAGVPEIVEEILGQVPIYHLYSSCRLVCRKWNHIILREKFLYWKKMYWRCKSGRCSQSHQTVTSLVKEVWSPTPYGVSLKTTTVPLVRFVSEQFPELEVSDELQKKLLIHPQSLCVTRIRELFPSVVSSKGSEAIARATLVVLCSKSVPEVQSVINYLLRSSSRRHEVMEVFYCLATLCLYGCHEVKKLPMRIHYNLFYAINLSERSFCGVAVSEPMSQLSAGQQSLHKYSERSSRELTAEQSEVVNHRLQPGEVIKVMAFAGTGKTTTLLRFTALNPNMSFLYCVYNKSVQEHAATIFPCNVKCRTFHSLAHGSRGDPVAVGWKYVAKRGSVNSYHISQCVKAPKGLSLFIFSRCILQTVEKFIASCDDEFLDEHIPTTIRRRRNEEVTPEEHAAQVRRLNDPKYRVDILKEAAYVWKKMIDTRDKDIRMSDDGYLKLFQLSKPEIRGYDCLLVDEAQDLTPAIISLVTCQACAKIFVGDTHQQIYGFRGATNALEQISANRIFHLTESFRFGPEIAYVSACTLSVLKNVWRQTLIGSPHTGRLDGNEVGQVAIIARMNITLFDEMVKIIRSGASLKLGFAGGIQKYDFDMYLDINNLRRGRNSEITHKFIKSWKSFDSLVKFAEKTDNVSLMNKIKASDTVKPARYVRNMKTCPNSLRKSGLCTPRTYHMQISSSLLHTRAKGWSLTLSN